MFDSGPIGREQRVFERLLLRCPVDFRQAGEKEEIAEGSAKDFSDGGVGVFSHSKIDEDTHLEMWIKISSDIKSVYIKGKVVWASQRRPGLWRAGVCFDEPAFIKVVKILVSKNLN